jgi:CRISPR-associated protein Csm5
MAEKSPRDHRRFVLRTLSPVHIGSGATAIWDVEIVRDGDRVLVLDFEEAIANLDPAIVSKRGFQGVNQLVPLLRQGGVDPASVSRHVLTSWPGNRTELRLFIRDAGGRPMIPGSSVKGAIRTAILAAKVADARASGRDRVADALRSAPRTPKFAAKGLEEHFFNRPPDGAGPDPKYDVFRLLAGTDAYFEEKAPEVLFVSVNSPSRENVRTMKNFRMAVEALPPGMEASMDLSLDLFLSGENARALNFGGVGLTWPNIEAWCRERSVALLQEERKVLAARQWTHAVQQLDQIAGELDGAPEGSIPLRLGWGIGWSGTTGGLATEAQRLELLRTYRMGKYGAEHYVDGITFPKTRRMVAPEEPGSEDPTFGWILLVPAGDRLIPLPPAISRSRHTAVPVTATAAVPKKPEASKRETWEGVLLTWNPGSAVITALEPGGRKAEVRGIEVSGILEQLGPDRTERLKKKKELKGVSVTVEPLGNLWRLLEAR